MEEENIGQEFRLKEIDNKKDYFIEEVEQNEWVSKRHKKVCRTLNYTEHLLILASTVTAYSSVSVFASLVGIPASVESSAAVIKICVITT